MSEFKNEVFSSYDPNPIRACSYCDKKPALVRTMRRLMAQVKEFAYGQRETAR